MKGTMYYLLPGSTYMYRKDQTLYGNTEDWCKSLYTFNVNSCVDTTNQNISMVHCPAKYSVAKTRISLFRST